MAIHTVNPEVPAPRFGSSPSTWLKCRVAKLTSSFPRRFGFGTDDMSMFSGMPTDMSMQQMQPHHAAGISPPITPNIASVASERPQTAAYALADSPSGLLAYMYDAIRPQTNGNAAASSGSASHSPESLRGVSPLMSPPSHYAHSYAASTPASRSGRSTASSSPVATRRSPPSNRSPPKLKTNVSSSSATSSAPGLLSRAASASDIDSPWHPAALIDWTMIYWLPGPEVALRWLVNSTALMPTYWASHSMVPLGISHFRDSAPQGNSTGTGKSPPQWAEAYHRVAMVRRREGRVRFPAWEVPVEVVMDLREFVGLLGIFAAAPAARCDNIHDHPEDEQWSLMSAGHGCDCLMMAF